MKNKFENLKLSDLITELEGELEAAPEIVKEADLYNHKLYVHVPKDHIVNNGILPEDQHFSTKYVILWSQIRSIPHVFDNDFKLLEVIIPANAILNNLRSVGAGAYAIPVVPNTWKIKEVRNVDAFSE